MTGLYSWLMFRFFWVLIDVAGKTCSDSGGRRIHGECLNGAWSVCREMVV